MVADIPKNIAFGARNRTATPGGVFLSYPTEPLTENPMRVHSILSAAIVFAASAAGAQPPAPKTDSGCVTTGDGRIECRRVVRTGDNGWLPFNRARMDSVMMKRAILGIELRPTGTKRDTLGVFVESVIPKGPAENAGIVEGDRIASINGVDLRVGSADVDDPYTNGLAAHRLNREVQKLTPGSRVSLRVYSGGRIRDVQLTAARASDFPNQGGFRIRLGGPGMMELDGPDGMGLDAEHMRMMIEDGMSRAGTALMKMRVPAGGMRLRAPMPPMPPRNQLLIRI
jgi:hypothetical protein